MFKAMLLFISVSGLATIVGCAGERKSSGLVTNTRSSGNVVVGTSYSLVFSAIEPALDGTGVTRVSVKLKNGNVVVTDGKLSRTEVTMLYRVNNPDGNDYFEKFDDYSTKKLVRGSTTFQVELEAGKVHQLRMEANLQIDGDEDSGQKIWGESGIFSVPDEEGRDEIDENL